MFISRPDLINMEVVSRQSNRDNLEQAFEIAESLGVTRLLDAEGESVGLFRIEPLCRQNSHVTGRSSPCIKQGVDELVMVILKINYSC